MKTYISITVLFIATASFAHDNPLKDPYQDNEFTKKHPNFASLDYSNAGTDLANPDVNYKDGREELTTDEMAYFAKQNTKGDYVNLENLSMEEMDRLYARLTSGPMPQGFHHGKVYLPKDNPLTKLGKLGVAVPRASSIKELAETLWGGKYFDSKRLFLRNRLDCEALKALSPDDAKGHEECVKAPKVPTQLTDANMRFPAKLYCGQSLADSRRESIIIDYRYGMQDTPKDLDKSKLVDQRIDWLAGKKGLLIRDEIRMLAPGVYLGRAYIHNVFGLFFVLKGTPAKDQSDKCWVGHQRQRERGSHLSAFGNYK